MGGTFSPAMLASVPTVPDSWIIAINVAKALVALASLVLFACSVLFLRRLQRMYDEVVRDVVDEEPFVTLPDDGQTITVYANKSGVVFYIVQFTLLSGILTGGGAWMRIDPRYQTGAVLLMLSGLFLGAFVVLGIVRLISKAPVLIVNADGITDNTTLIATGMGLIPWREILGLRIQGTRSGRFLTVEADNNKILREQVPWKRALLVLVRSPLGLIRIRELLLPMPLEELRAQIEEYLSKHGHELPLAHVPAETDVSASGD